jgi:hypothetical protein
MEALPRLGTDPDRYRLAQGIIVKQASDLIGAATNVAKWEEQSGRSIAHHVWNAPDGRRNRR